jgi:hypothetical protein
VVSDVLGYDIGSDYESVAKKWLCNTKFGVANVISSPVCWGLWKLRNVLCSQGVPWCSMKKLWGMVIPMLKCWSVLIPLKMLAAYEGATAALENAVWRPEPIERTSFSGAAPDGVQDRLRDGVFVF